MIPTPQVAIPIDRTPSGGNTIPATDGRGEVRIDTPAAAYEAIGLATLAILQSSRLVEQEGDAYDVLGPDSALYRRVRAQSLGAVARAASALQLAADLYERHNLPVTMMPEWMRREGIGWERAVYTAVDVPGRSTETTTWTFSRPADWRAFAGYLVASTQRQADDVDDAPQEMGEPVISTTAVLWIVYLVGAVLVAGVVYAGIVRVMRHLFWEQRVVEDRIDCFDQAMQRYEETGDPAALARAEACYEQAETYRRAAGGGKWALGLGVGVAAAAALYLATRN